MFGHSYFPISYFGGSYFGPPTTVEIGFRFPADRGTRVEEILFVGSNVFINNHTLVLGQNVQINTTGFFGKILSPISSNLMTIGNNDVVITPMGVFIGPLTINTSGVFISGVPI